MTAISADSSGSPSLQRDIAPALPVTKAVGARQLGRRLSTPLWAASTGPEERPASSPSSSSHDLGAAGRRDLGDIDPEAWQNHVDEDPVAKKVNEGHAEEQIETAAKSAGESGAQDVALPTKADVADGAMPDTAGTTSPEKNKKWSLDMDWAAPVGGEGFDPLARIFSSVVGGSGKAQRASHQQHQQQGQVVRGSSAPPEIRFAIGKPGETAPENRRHWTRRRRRDAAKAKEEPLVSMPTFFPGLGARLAERLPKRWRKWLLPGSLASVTAMAARTKQLDAELAFEPTTVPGAAVAPVQGISEAPLSMLVTIRSQRLLRGDRVQLDREARIRRRLAFSPGTLGLLDYVIVSERGGQAFLLEERITGTLHDALSPKPASNYIPPRFRLDKKPPLDFELRSRVPLIPRDAILLGIGLLRGLRDLEDAGIVPAHLNEASIFVAASDGRPLIGNLSGATILQGDAVSFGSPLTGPSWNWPPEWQNGHATGHAGVVWLAGRLLAELALGWDPIEEFVVQNLGKTAASGHPNLEPMARHMVTRSFKFTKVKGTEHLDTRLKVLFNNMLQGDPETRWSAQSALYGFEIAAEHYKIQVPVTIDRSALKGHPLVSDFFGSGSGPWESQPPTATASSATAPGGAASPTQQLETPPTPMSTKIFSFAHDGENQGLVSGNFDGISVLE